VSRGVGEDQFGGGIRFALREVLRGEGVLGVKWCCVCSFVAGFVDVAKVYILLMLCEIWYRERSLIDGKLV
jgi:hypothetical protein